MNCFSTLQLGEDPVALLIKTDRNNFLSQPEHSPKLPQLKAEALNNFAIGEFNQQRALIEQRDSHPQRSKHRRVFQPNNPRTHNDQIPRQFLQLMHLVGIKNSFAVDRNIVDVRWPRTARDQNMLPAQQLRSILSLDFNRMRIDESSLT